MAFITEIGKHVTDGFLLVLFMVDDPRMHCHYRRVTDVTCLLHLNNRILYDWEKTEWGMEL